jgi:hypothetical protein
VSVLLPLRDEALRVEPCLRALQAQTGVPRMELLILDDWPELRDGYATSLWAAFGSAPGAVGVIGLLIALHVVPVVAAIGGSPVGLGGYAAGVAGRALAARRTGGRVWPDALAHPASVAVLGWLTALSWRRRRAGQLTWKGRRLPVWPR